MKVPMRTERDYQSCASRLKALADPDRLQIVNSLLQSDKCVSSIAEELGMPIDKVSHHLGVLRAAQLVQTQKQGKFVIYSLPPEIATESVSDKGSRTIDLGCCQLDIVQVDLPCKSSREGGVGKTHRWTSANHSTLKLRLHRPASVAAFIRSSAGARQKLRPDYRPLTSSYSSSRKSSSAWHVVQFAGLHLVKRELYQELRRSVVRPVHGGHVKVAVLPP